MQVPHRQNPRVRMRHMPGEREPRGRVPPSMRAHVPRGLPAQVVEHVLQADVPDVPEAGQRRQDHGVGRRIFDRGGGSGSPKKSWTRTHTHEGPAHEGEAEAGGPPGQPEHTGANLEDPHAGLKAFTELPFFRCHGLKKRFCQMSSFTSASTSGGIFRSEVPQQCFNEVKTGAHEMFQAFVGKKKWSALNQRVQNWSDQEVAEEVTALVDKFPDVEANFRYTVLRALKTAHQRNHGAKTSIRIRPENVENISLATFYKAFAQRLSRSPTFRPRSASMACPRRTRTLFARTRFGTGCPPTSEPSRHCWWWTRPRSLPACRRRQRLPSPPTTLSARHRPRSSAFDRPGTIACRPRSSDCTAGKAKSPPRRSQSPRRQGPPPRCLVRRQSRWRSRWRSRPTFASLLSPAENRSFPSSRKSRPW